MSGLLILVVAAVCALMAVGLVLAGFGIIGADKDRDQVKRSLASIESINYSSKKNQVSSNELPLHDRLVAPTWARMLEVGRKMTPPQRRESLRVRLEIAGNPTGWDIDRIVAMKTVGLFGGAALGLLLPLLMGAFVPMIVLIPGMAALGFFMPDFAVYQASYNRTEKIQRELADAMDLLTVSVEAGLGFDAALSQVARNTTGPLSDEFSRVLQEMQIGTGRTEALRALTDRTKVEELDRFVAAMVQADKLGVPISRVLRVQAKEMRVQRTQRAETLAQKVPVKILFPLIFCILPPLFIVILGPAIINIATYFSTAGS